MIFATWQATQLCFVMSVANGLATTRTRNFSSGAKISNGDTNTCYGCFNTMLFLDQVRNCQLSPNRNQAARYCSFGARERVQTEKERSCT